MKENKFLKTDLASLQRSSRERTVKDGKYSLLIFLASSDVMILLLNSLLIFPEPKRRHDEEKFNANFP